MAERKNPRSWKITEGHDRAPNRAMMRAVGFDDADFGKPIVGIAHSDSNITPCNLGLAELAVAAAEAIHAAGGMPQTYGTITISDGISMGTEGMKCSLVSREVIADSIETVARGQMHDGVLAIGGCDKNMPGALIALARLDIPAIFVYGGTIKAGRYGGNDLTVVSVFEAVGAHGAGKMTDTDFVQIERCAIPGKGSCGGMYTANTMASAIEALGMSLPNSSAQNAMSKAKVGDCRRAGAAVVEMLRKGIRPLDIMTRKAFENAITVVIALGGSTNAVVHLIAMAGRAGNARSSSERICWIFYDPIRSRVGPPAC
jgi:dihydroxy-acid dehydratase